MVFSAYGLSPCLAVSTIQFNLACCILRQYAMRYGSQAFMNCAKQKHNSSAYLVLYSDLVTAQMVWYPFVLWQAPGCKSCFRESAFAAVLH